MTGSQAAAQSALPTIDPPGANPIVPDRLESVSAQPVTIEQLAERLQAMEAMNRRLAEELEQSRAEHRQQMNMLLERFDSRGNEPIVSGISSPPLEAPETLSTAVAPRNSPDLFDSPVPDYTEGQLSPFSSAPGFPTPGRGRSADQPLLGRFRRGFQLETPDQEYTLRVHLESQIEGRVWNRDDRLPPGSGTSGIYLPRQRIFFNGNITKPIEYEFSINRGVNNLNLLNAFINIHFDDRFEVRFGRFFTPIPYDQYAISNYWLLTPERSVFTTNVGLNRQFGLMAWGYLLEKQIDYAAGVFNGGRNSFENLNNALDFVGYLNARPFQESGAIPFLRFLNLGTSVAYGYQDQPPSPIAFRIGGGSPDTNIPGSATVPFLLLNRDVVEQGDRLIGSVHTAYFYKGLSLVGEWQYGFGSYASPNRASTHVSLSGFYVAGGYFLTGEEVERRTIVRPLRPLIGGAPGEPRGWGAWEATGRVSQLRLGDEVFTAGFADPNLWFDQATTTEVGLNWYWNEYIKLYMFWLHGEFGRPSGQGPGQFNNDADMFWLRFQLYF